MYFRCVYSLYVRIILTDRFSNEDSTIFSIEINVFIVLVWFYDSYNHFAASTRSISNSNDNRSRRIRSGIRHRAGSQAGLSCSRGTPYNRLGRTLSGGAGQAAISHQRYNIPECRVWLRLSMILGLVYSSNNRDHIIEFLTFFACSSSQASNY